MKYIKLFERFGSDSEFVVIEKETIVSEKQLKQLEQEDSNLLDNLLDKSLKLSPTTADQLKKELNRWFGAFKNGGGGQKIIDLFFDILCSSLEFAGYDENDAEEICDKLEYRFKFTSNEVILDDDVANNGSSVPKTYEILFKYTSGNNGQDFKVTEYEPEVILNIIKVILEKKLDSELIKTYNFGFKSKLKPFSY